MKFDFAIGNPPYQDNAIGENDTYAPPVYNKFLDAAYAVADSVEMIHPAMLDLLRRHGMKKC